jgi:cystathionine beta-lyase
MSYPVGKMRDMTAELVVPALAELRRRRSVKWRTFPDDVLPLFVAESDYDLAPPVAEAVQAAIRLSDTGYAAPGAELGKAYSGFAERRWGWTVDPEQVTAVPDVEIGVIELLRVLTRPGDAVAISPPVYPPFFDWAPESGARLLEVPLARDDDGYRLDLAAIEAAFATHPAVYLLCNPQNPVGRVHTADELAELVRLATAYRVVIVSDEIHAPLVLPGATFTPLLSVPGAAGIAVSVVSASKAFNLAGLKCAAVVTAGRRMATAVERFPRDMDGRTGHLGVIASVAAFTDGDPWLAALLHTLDARRTQLGALLRDRLPAISWVPSQATYLAWLDCSALGPDAREVFLSRGRVAVEPGLRFGAVGAGHVRFNFGTSPSIVDDAVARMAAAVAG